MDEQYESAIANVKIWWREADESERTADRRRWDVAEELFNLNIICGVPQEELADKLERSQVHIHRYIKVWRVYGLDGDDERLSFNECYQKCKRAGSPKRKPDDDSEQSGDLADDEESQSGSESDNPGYSECPSLLDLLAAIAEGIDPFVFAEKATPDNWRAWQELGETVYHWICEHDNALEDRFNPLAEAS